MMFRVFFENIIFPGRIPSEPDKFFWLVIISALPLLLGYIVDLLIGDPHWLPHPIRFIGWSIVKLEKLLLKNKSKSNTILLYKGLIMAVLIPFSFFVLTLCLLIAAYRLHFATGFILETVLCWQIIATKSLKTETNKVYEALQRRDLPTARKYLSWLVGRDTQKLSEQDIIRATVETIAENTTDGVVAPVFFMAIGGAPLAMAYKAINTLDSMVGYKNEKYLFFGRASAKLDDAANFLPARIAAFLMIVAAFLSGFSGKKAWQIFKRDRQNHLSPNSAQTEAVCAGALGIQLGGSHRYDGKIVEKPTIGESTRFPLADDIVSTQKLMYISSLFCLIIFWPMRILFLMIGAINI